MIDASARKRSHDDRSLTLAIAISIAAHLLVLFFGRISLAPPAAALEPDSEYPVEVAFLLDEDLEEYFPARELGTTGPLAIKDDRGPIPPPVPESRNSAEDPYDPAISSVSSAPPVVPLVREEPVAVPMTPRAAPAERTELVEPERSLAPAVPSAPSDEARPRESENATAAYVPSPSIARRVEGAGNAAPAADALPTTEGGRRSAAPAPEFVGVAGGSSPVSAPAGPDGDASLRDIYLGYRERIGRILVAAIQRRFRREAVRRDEGTVTFQIEMRSGILRRITQISSESPLLERVTRQAIEETAFPAPPAGLPEPLAFRFRSRFALESP
jgi:hypothetical protein